MTRLKQCFYGFTEFLQIIIKLLKSLQTNNKIKYKLYKTTCIKNIFNIRLIKIIQINKSKL